MSKLVYEELNNTKAELNNVKAELACERHELKREQNALKREKLINKIKIMCYKEIHNFRMDKRNRELIASLDKTTLIQAVIADALEEYIEKSKAFNEKDIHGNYIISDKYLELFAENGHMLNRAWDIFRDREFKLCNPATFHAMDMVYTVDICEEILFDKKKTGENNDRK